MTTAQAEPTGYALGLLSLGGIAVFLAANGLKLAQVSRDGAKAAEKEKARKEAVAASTSADKAKDHQFAYDTSEPPEPNADPILTVEGAELYRAEDIPLQVLVDLMTKLKPNSPDKLIKPADVKNGQRRPGKGNHAWYVTLLDGETFRVSYGGRGHTEGSVQKV